MDKESEGWWIKYHKKQRFIATDALYHELKKCDDDEGYGISHAHWNTIQKIRQENICLTSSDLTELNKTLENAYEKHNKGEFDKSMIGRGILSMPMSAMLEFFEKSVTDCLEKTASIHRAEEDESSQQIITMQPGR